MSILVTRRLSGVAGVEQTSTLIRKRLNSIFKKTQSRFSATFRISPSIWPLGRPARFAVGAFSLDSDFADPGFSEPEAMVAERPSPPLSMETVCERAQLTWRRSCHSIARRAPRLCPSAHAQSKLARARYPYKRIANVAIAPVRLEAGLHPDSN